MPSRKKHQQPEAQKPVVRPIYVISAVTGGWSVVAVRNWLTGCWSPNSGPWGCSPSTAGTR